MSDTQQRPAPAFPSKLLRGEAADKAVAAAAITSTLDEFVPVKIAPKTAAEELAAKREAAIQQGYNDGLLKAKAEVEAAMNDANTRVHRALAALCEAADAFDRREVIALADIEDVVASAALTIAAAVLQRELEVAADPGAEAIARALKFAPAQGDITAHLNPCDVETLSMDHVSTSSRTVHVVADPNVEPGGCIVEVGDTRVDAQISSALDNVRTALRLGDHLPIEQVAPARMEASLPSGSEHAIAGSDALEVSGTTASEAPTA